MLIRQFLLIFIIGVLSVNFSEAQSNNRREYTYNHPPSVAFDTIPVAVVYEDENERENKALKLSANFKTIPISEFITDKNIFNKDEPTIQVNSDVIVDISSEQKNEKHIKLNDSGNRSKNYEIPVSVIYDEDSSISRSAKRIDANNVRKKQKQTRRRPLKLKSVTNNVSINVDANTNESQTKNNSENTILPNQRVMFDIEPNKAINIVKAPNPDQIPPVTEFRKRTRLRDPVVPIVTEKNYVFAYNGNFHYSFEGGDGTKVFEEGELKTIENDKAGEAVVGSYSYKDKEGNDFSLTYTADENGYRPMGAHLPTPPPIPPAIARALEYLATKTTPQPVTERTKIINSK